MKEANGINFQAQPSKHLLLACSLTAATFLAMSISGQALAQDTSTSATSTTSSTTTSATPANPATTATTSTDSSTPPVDRANLLKIVEQCDEQIAKNNSDFKAFIDRAHAFYDLGNFGLAAEDLTWALQLQPTDGRWYIWRAKCYSKLGKDDKAMTDVKEAIRIKPSAAAYVVRGDLYEKAKQHTEAIADYTQALTLDSKNIDALTRRAAVYKESGDLADAEKDLSAVIAAKPHVTAYVQRARLTKDTNTTAALADANKALELDPNNTEALNLRAMIFGKLNDPAKAVQDLTVALNLSPLDQSLLLKRAQAYLHLNKLDNAMTDINNAILNDPNESNLYLTRAYIYNRQGNSALAQEDVKRAQFCNPLLPKSIDLESIAALDAKAPQ